MIRYLRLILAIPLMLVAMACSTNPTVANGGDPELEAEARAALQQLFDSTPKAKDLQYQAKGVVVFPSIVKAGLIVGAQGGKGVMFSPDGKVLGYYRARALSYGMQAGAQTFSEAMFFMTDASLNYLRKTGGWEVGTAPSLVVVDAGIARSLSTTTLKKGIYVFFFSQKGLMGGIGLQGTKITQYTPSA